LVRWKGTKAEEWVVSTDFHDLTPIRKFVEKKVLRKNAASQEPECITGIDLIIPGEINAKRKNDANQNQEFITMDLKTSTKRKNDEIRKRGAGIRRSARLKIGNDQEAGQYNQQATINLGRE
jgi:hypothetical protein